MGGSLRTRHSRVIPKVSPGTTSIRAPPPASLPRFAASDTGGCAAAQVQRQACACHRPCIDDLGRACGAASPAHRGPQAPRHARSRPWRREWRGSLCRGGQGLWTLWTAETDAGGGFAWPAADYYSVIIRSSLTLRVNPRPAVRAGARCAIRARSARASDHAGRRCERVGG